MDDVLYGIIYLPADSTTNVNGKKRVCKVKLENLSQFFDCYPEKLINALLAVAHREKKQLYVVGGTIRDLLLGNRSNDLDITVAEDSSRVVRQLIRELKGGAFVDLCGAEDEAARIVWQNIQVDVASFREGAKSIEEDLLLRDFTINSIGAELEQLVALHKSPELIDPTGGFTDLTLRRLRHCSSAFIADPVRMLRGYRLYATLNFQFEKETENAIKKNASLITAVAAERIIYELDLIFDSPRTAATLLAMHESSLLEKLLPELYEGKGVLQPKFHHLDVFEHNMLALEMMEYIIAEPEKYFPGMAGRIGQYLENGLVPRWLKWAALLHDIGKPATREMSTKDEGRVTFYGHDETGREMFCQLAERMRWSRRGIDNVGALIGMHMHPFHLCNIARTGKITKRAALKLCKRAGEQLPGLFFLAMSDSLAGKGEEKPKRMEEEIVALLDRVLTLYEENIRPVLHGPRLLTGRDLIDNFGLHPGPVFSKIFAGLEIAMVEGEVADRHQAMGWVSDFLAKEKYEEEGTVLSKENKWTKTCVK